MIRFSEPVLKHKKLVAVMLLEWRLAARGEPPSDREKPGKFWNARCQAEVRVLPGDNSQDKGH